MNRKAIVLLSGGIDSSVTLYLAQKKGLKCHCLIFDYGQRHKKEIESAKKIAKITNSSYEILKIYLPWKGSSLLNRRLPLSKRTKEQKNQRTRIPLTYVPARNTIFLSFALSYAEAIGAEKIFIGANSIDYAGYPDCRPEFYRTFVKMAELGTKTGVEKRPIKIITPLIDKTKAQIIRLGSRLGVPFEFTWSCYQSGKKPCQECDSCYFRKKGFKEAGIEDLLLVQASNFNLLKIKGL